MELENIRIIQGGMGVHVSSSKLAKAVAQRGQLGVVSGTAIDAVLGRKLQLGDPDGSIRRALDHFPFRDMAQRVFNRFFHPVDTEAPQKPARPFKGFGMPSIPLPKARAEWIIVANYVEVFLAREGHDGPIGINYLEKIQWPTLPSLFGAMLAGVNVVLMGAGIPSSIPGILDQLASWKEVSLRVQIEDNPTQAVFEDRLDPTSFVEGDLPTLIRPHFLAIISSDTVARTLEKRASGRVDGYVVENHVAGGHNAPPRRDRNADGVQTQGFGPKDEPNLENIRKIGKPFWLAGGFAGPEHLATALKEGATGIQVGTPFAFCNESGMDPVIRQEVLESALDGKAQVETSFTASPTGYPFKIVHPGRGRFEVADLQARKRVCDLGYLRTAYVTGEGSLAWRCAAEPVEDYVRKGGDAADTQGKLCLCNGLLSTVGLGQVRSGQAEPPLLTSGNELMSLAKFLPEGQTSFSAGDVIRRILS